MQNILLIGILSFCTLLLHAKPQVVPLDSLQPDRQQSRTAMTIAQVMSDYHYTQPDINDALSQLAWQRYLDILDPNRSFFTQDDIRGFRVYRNQFDDYLVKGRLQPAYKMFKQFRQKVVERIAYATQLLNHHTFDFDRQERYVFDRTEGPWAIDNSALNDIWRQRIKNDLLIEKFAETAEQAPDQATLKANLQKRYANIARRVKQMTAEDVFQRFVNAIALSIEPHTSYMSPRTSENFDIDMRLSLQGIGAVLREDNEYTSIVSVVPGGPAKKSGSLHAGDRIVGVAQGKAGVMQDVMGWRLQDVVDLIRGVKGSMVRLQILPKRAGMNGTLREITLTREQIKLEDKAASSQIVDHSALAGTKIGVIDVPTFYRDFAAQSAGKKDFRSTTRDVRALLKTLQAADVDGIVVDLRGNGGGSLTEATELTGLFIRQGPVVQVKDVSGNVQIERDRDPEQVYAGPLVVLVDRNSASASEIFAGAIQDYGRGLIVGEPTFGKGTVQTLIDLRRYIKHSQHTGRLRLTMAQFFRVEGASTQHQGVVPDIVFPTATSVGEHGERALDHALPWARIQSVVVKPKQRFALASLNKQHQQRIANDPGFEYLLGQEEAFLRMQAVSDISLHQTTRQAEREKREAQHLQRRNKLRQYRGLPVLTSLETEDEQTASDEDDDPEGIRQIMLDEAALILADAIQQR